MNHKQEIRGRRDHYLPQGYLRGFIDPSRAKVGKPLWCLDLNSRKWRERSTKEIGYIDGFYDYALENASAESPDVTFQYLENNFPRVRDQLISDNFATWLDHTDFLLRYMQMIRARSPLFFDQWSENAKELRLSTVMEGRDSETQLVDFIDRPMSEGEVRNWTITQMRTQIRSGPDWMADFHWSLRYTDSCQDPVITADQPLISVGPSADLGGAMNHPETLIYFPICWQAFLFGSRQRFDIPTERFDSSTLDSVRRAYLESGRKFLISPRKLTDFV